MKFTQVITGAWHDNRGKLTHNLYALGSDGQVYQYRRSLKKWMPVDAPYQRPDADRNRVGGQPGGAAGVKMTITHPDGSRLHLERALDGSCGLVRIATPTGDEAKIALYDEKEVEMVGRFFKRRADESFDRR